jgi:hypothetical protein
LQEIETLLDLLTRADFLAGVLAGGLALVTMQMLTRSEAFFDWGLALVVAALVGLTVSRGPQPGLTVGLVALGIGGWLVGRSEGADPTQTGPAGGWLLVVGGAYLAATRGDVPSGMWFTLLAMSTIIASGWVMRLWAKVDAPFLGALFLITAFGIWATVPDTDSARVLLGAAVPLALGTTQMVGGRLTSAGAFALAGLVVWIGATGGEARPASIIGAWASFGLIVILPIAMGWLRNYRVAFVLIGQGLLVFVTARVIGFGDDAAPAIVATALVYGLLLGGLRVVASRSRDAITGHD